MEILTKRQKSLFLVLIFLAISISACGNPTSTPGNTLSTTTTQLLFVSTRNGAEAIYMMDIDRSGLLEIGDGWNPVWSPDRKQIAFSGISDGNSEIFVMNSDGSEITRLTNRPEQDWHPTWSNDGKQIAFTSDYEIYVMNVDGSGLTNITNHPAADYHPAWSPDGTQIAFVSERAGAGDKVAIFVMNIDGSEPKLLVGTGYDSEPAWSPDNKRIVFVSARDGNLDIYVMNADGSNQVRLTNDPANESEPAWSHDGTKIVFVSDRDGNSEIYMMNTDGTGQENITQNPATDKAPAW